MIDLRPKVFRSLIGSSWRTRVIVAAVLISLLTIALLLINDARIQAELVRTDPDAAAHDARLMRTAIWRGRTEFDRNCASCHGNEGRGNSERGVPDLTDAEWLYGSGKVGEIESIILHGIRAPNPKSKNLADMPAFASPVPYSREPTMPSLQPADIRDLVQYLHHVGGKPSDAAAAARGAEIFSSRGGCYDCHSADARGDSDIGGPDLTDPVWLYGGSTEAITRSIADGRAGYCPAFADKLRAAEVRSLALYVFSLSRRPSPGPELNHAGH